MLNRMFIIYKLIKLEIIIYKLCAAPIDGHFADDGPWNENHQFRARTQLIKCYSL